jgi:cytochrome P450
LTCRRTSSGHSHRPSGTPRSRSCEPLHYPAYVAGPESPFRSADGAYYALVRHADVVEASRSPDIFSSARGSTSIADLPAEFNEYFGSMINMDDPRHARLRRIVSRAFTRE